MGGTSLCGGSAALFRTFERTMAFDIRDMLVLKGRWAKLKRHSASMLSLHGKTDKQKPGHIVLRRKLKKTHVPFVRKFRPQRWSPATGFGEGCLPTFEARSCRWSS